MLRNRAVALILGLFASPLVIALGLGTLQSSSSLNEPFTGRIELIGASAGDFDALTVKLASLEQFKRAGISLNPLLYQLKFSLEENRSGKDFISITSKDPIREPFLNFLVELNWSNGRLLREYTVLLDPPLYDANRRRAQATTAAAPAPAATSPQAAATPPAPAPSVASYSAGNQYGPVGSTDTLWSIASSLRPDESVTVQQMMLALLRENPDAFGEGNINLLRRGAVLRLPDADSLRTISAGEAFAEVQRQHQLWENYRNQIADVPTSQPVGAPAAASDDTAPAARSSAADSRLELIAPGGTDSGGSPGRGAAGGSDLLREEIDARAQQNDELSGKLLEAEEIIDLLQRQVNIKDEELAALQARLAELGIEHGDAGMVEDDAASGDDPDMADDEPDEQAPADDEVVDDSDLDADSDDDMVGVDDDVADEAADDTGPAPTAASEQPSAARAFPHSLIPEHIAAMVPGGALTVLGLIAAAILGLFAAVIGFLMKSRGGESESRPAVSVARAKAAPEIDSEDATVTAPTDIPDDDSEAVTEIGASGDAQSGFDPNATVEAAADGDAAFTTTATDLPAMPAAPGADEEDPLEEINVYLAYERFDQAEELVKRVIGQYPDRHEYKLRLLEVYYSSNDRAEYENAARELFDAVGDSDPLWESAVAMWSEMSPDRALFAEGAVADAEPAGEAAKTFVDITGDAEASEAGERTLAHAPGGDSELDFDLADSGDDDVLDLTATTDDDDVLDLTAATDDDDVLDLTAAADDDDVLDLTAATDEDKASDSADADGVLDITDGGDDEVLDITSGGGDDLLDISGGGAPDDSDNGDLLDVTKTGDVSTVDDGDLLNVTSPGLRAEDLSKAAPAEPPSEDAADLEITDITGGDEDDQALDFDISDTVAPAFEDAAGAADDEILDLTGGSASDDGDLLDFDIGGLDDDLEDTNSPAEQNEIDTLDLDSVPAVADAEPALEDELDFDITMDGDDLTKGVAVVENEDEEGRLEITMSSPDEPPVDGTPSESDEFDFALDGTTEMDAIAADDTLDMGKVDTGDEAEIDLSDDASLDDLTQQLDGALDDSALEELDIGGIEVEGESDDQGGEEHIETVALDSDELPEIDFGDEKTVAMPVGDDVERQSDSDEADTKLNLAKAYIELGDTDGARSILDEVANEGNEAQQAEAKSLLSQL